MVMSREGEAFAERHGIPAGPSARFSRESGSGPLTGRLALPCRSGHRGPTMRSQIMSTMIETRTFYTPEDLLGLPDSKNYELVDGKLVERNMGFESGWVASGLLAPLARFCKEHHLGWALSSDGGYQCFPHRPSLVRRPDVSFVKFGRFPKGVLPRGWAKIPPDLVVEVVSPNDTVYDLE